MEEDWADLLGGGGGGRWVDGGWAGSAGGGGGGWMEDDWGGAADGFAGMMGSKSS